MEWEHPKSHIFCVRVEGNLGLVRAGSYNTRSIGYTMRLEVLGSGVKCQYNRSRILSLWIFVGKFPRPKT